MSRRRSPSSCCWAPSCQRILPAASSGRTARCGAAGQDGGVARDKFAHRVQVEIVKHILVAFDGSESAARAFAFGLDLADKFAAALHVLAVVRPPELPEDVETEALVESAREYYERQFGPLQARAAKAGIEAAFAVS